VTQTIKTLLTDSSARLADSSDSARLDAEILLGKVLKKDRAFLFANPDFAPDPAQLSMLEDLIAQRAAGKPVAYLIGSHEFWSLQLTVTPDVLVPRPETELLVEQTLRHIPGKADCRVADLGCGSGAIAIAIATERPLADITATDCSAAALQVATQNAAAHDQGHIRFIESNWLAGLTDESFNILVSNPPYVATDQPELTDPELEHEPPGALFSGSDGLDDIRSIIEQAPSHLANKGWLLLEHGFDQAAAIASLMEQARFTRIECYKDLAGHDRVTAAQITQPS
jgi:release factor glutamine methyltransferase